MSVWGSFLCVAALRYRFVDAPSPVDWRDVVRGGQLLSSDPGQYYNQPQLVQLRNGSWTMVLTNAGFKEGEANQRVVARFHREPDLRQGTWSAPIDIENQPFGPSSGWAVPLYAPEVGGACGRLYAIYTYNGENITTMPGSGSAACHCQLVGGQWFRYSDDAGTTWSRRYPIPIRSTSIDRMNPWGGRVLQGWTVSKPIMMPSGAVLLPYTKIGTYVQAHERQWVVRSTDIMREANVSKLAWETWPEGDGGATQGCPPMQGDIAEEGGLLSLGGTHALYIFRTANGHINECVSDDDGRSWRPRTVHYRDVQPTGRGQLKSPRGPLTARRLSDGTFALLFFCNGWKGYSGASNNTRNPYFLSLGQLTAGGDDIEWSQPEIVLYGRGWLPGALSPAYNLAYPDLVQQADGSVVVFAVFESPPGTACNRSEFLAIGGCGVSAHVVPSALLSGLRAQLSPPDPAPRAPVPALVNRSLLFDMRGAAHGVAAPAWPDLDQPGNGSGSGITLEWWQGGDAAQQKVGGGQGLFGDTSSIFSCMGADGAGIRIAPAHAAQDGSIEVQFTAPGGQPVLSVKSEPGLLTTTEMKRSLHLAVIVDAGPQMVYFHHNGRFCDGGDNSTFGYTFFRRLPQFWRSNDPMHCNISASRTRVYGTYLTTSELVLNDRTSR